MHADTLMRRLHELEEENKRLKSLLSEHGIPFEACAHDGNLTASQFSNSTDSTISLSLQEKVELFQSLFKGREDVFAKRWYSDTSKKSGYQPVCEREWNREFCDKRRYKCSSAKEKRMAMEKLENIPASDTLVIVATGKYIGEGFDYPRLDTLLLALPISWKGNIAQYAGRLHRDYDGKNEVRIYDYIDIRIPLCDSMYRKRLRGYASVGYGVTKRTGGNSISKPELIYDGHTFSEPFHQDLLATKQSIVISCQKIKFKYAPRLLYLLRDLMTNGIEVVVWVKEQGNSDQELVAYGIEVQYDENLSVQCAIIDKSTVWYGSINFFGYNKEENNVLRIFDSSIANELLDIICGQC